MIGDDKIRHIIGVDNRFFAADVADTGEARAALQLLAKLREALWRADGIHFHAAVRKIAHVAHDLQTLSGVLGKIPVTDTLNGSGYKKALGLSRRAHKPENCSRPPVQHRKTIGIQSGNPGNKNEICCKLGNLSNVAKLPLRYRPASKPMMNLALTIFRSFAAMGRRRLPHLALALLIISAPAAAQESAPAPLNPPPEHSVRRMGTTPEPEAPPPVPPEEIIRKFSQKEEEFQSVRPTYGYKKTVRIDEFDHEGRLAGQFLMVTEVMRAANGQLVNKVLEKPQSTLHLFNLEPEDAKELDRVPPFPLTTSQLSHYELKYLGTEQVDEVLCYIFQVKPKIVDRARGYFDGIAWVDTKELEVVKTFGKWVNELGDVHVANMPFTTYETYRENVDGKYWFPNYQRSDDTLHLKDTDVPVRLTIKWTDFKPLAPASAAAPPTNPAPVANPGAPPPAQPASPKPQS